MKKRVISVFLSMLLVVSLWAGAYADYSEGYLYYTIENESVTITGCYGRQEELTVPNMIAGYPVNHIAAEAFTGNQYLKLVNLPDTIMSIEEGAFDPSITVNMSAFAEAATETPSPTQEAVAETGSVTEGEETASEATSETPAPVENGAQEALHQEGTVVDDLADESEEESSLESVNRDGGEKLSAEPNAEPAEAVPTAELADPTAGPGQSGGSMVWLWCLLGVALLAAAAVPVLRRQRKS